MCVATVYLSSSNCTIFSRLPVCHILVRFSLPGLWCVLVGLMCDCMTYYFRIVTGKKQLSQTGSDEEAVEDEKAESAQRSGDSSVASPQV